jgi:hypothetical protein
LVLSNRIHRSPCESATSYWTAPMGKVVGVACRNVRKLNPSKRINLRSVPFRSRGSRPRFVQLVTEPPVQPFLLPQCSLIYCESSRCGSIAWAVNAQCAATKPINMILRRLCRLQFASGEVFEFLNHNLIFFFQRAFLAGNQVKQELKSLLPRRGYPRCEDVLENNGGSGFSRRAANGFETGSTRFPMQ